MIKTVIHSYENHIELEQFLIDQNLTIENNVLIQVYAGVWDKEKIAEIQRIINKTIPNGILLGTTTSGEIIEGKSTENNILLIFTVFEKTRLSACLLKKEDFVDSFLLGKNLAIKLLTNETRGFLVFSTNGHIEPQYVIDGIHEINSDLYIAGAVAGKNNDHQIVFDKEQFTEDGVVAVALNNKDLHVDVFSSHKWQEIGNSIQVTKANGTTIYSLNNKKPAQILRRYFGDSFSKHGLSLSTEFPFLLEKNGEKLPLFVTKLLPNGSIKVNRPVQNGDSFVIAFTDIEGTVEQSLQEMRRLAKVGAETIFAYSCLTRNRTLRQFSEEEIKILQSISSTNGFYGDGELVGRKGEKPQYFGQAITYIALSEEKKHSGMNEKISYEIPAEYKTLLTLTHLMKASQEDILSIKKNALVSQGHFRSLFENNTDIVYATDLNGNLTSVNPAFEKIVGMKEEEVVGTSALKYIHHEDSLFAKRHFLRSVKGRQQLYNIRIVTKSGSILYFQVKNIPITVNGEIIGIYGIGRNITDQRKIEEKINQLVYYDQQTGLPNRLRFTEMLREFLLRSNRKKRRLAVISIDLDRFKIVNDSFGLQGGDRILKEVSKRIKEAIPTGAYLGRFSGDKFIVAIIKNASVDEVMSISKSILQQISLPLKCGEQEFIVTASIGISFYPNDGLDEVTLLKNADLAMNRSKYLGGNRITLYSEEMNEEARKRLEMENDLRKAIKNEEFQLYYQPLICLETGKLSGSEALIRWQHPKLGLVSPGEFIPLAEETGLIDEIGSWVLQTACKQNKIWQEMGMEHLTVSVNVSASQFQQKNFVEEVRSALRESKLEAKYLTLELTESTMLRNLEHSIFVMKELQRLGVKVSIDDFGTGYSSLSYLKNLPINTLKIDRSFINNLKVDESDIAIVKAIITMGHGLSVKVVAEGVETKEQIELLKELKCHYAQGFYINRPLPIEDFEKLLLKGS